MSYKHASAGSVLAALLAVAAPKLAAQATPAANSTGQGEDETIVLSPFVIEAGEDQSGYSATSTLAGTRIRTDLKDVASSISVVTKQFLQDTNSHNAGDLLVYTPNTEVGGLQGNFSGQAANTIYNESTINSNSQTRVRGLDAADNTRDYFLTDIPFDTFNTERVDLQRGPNSILFGVGSPAGIINSSLNMASFKTGYHYENVTSKYGSERNSIDLNQLLIKNQLAIRFAALVDDQKYQQKPAYNNTVRYYGALRFDPKLFSEDVHTSLRANFEWGKVNSNNPRIIPPDDQITPWFNTSAQFGVPALNRFTINEYTPGQGAGSDLAKANTPNFAVGRTYWPTPIVYFNGSSTKTPGQNPGALSSLPTNIIIGEMTTGWAINTSGQIAPPNQPGSGTNIGIGGLPNYQPRAIAPYAHYASANLVGGSYYADKVLTDTSVFDFFNNLLDGNTKHEWQQWHAFNVAFSQTFLHDTLGYEIAYDQQMYLSGQTRLLNGENYGINVDVNSVLADGSVNPNVGRPYVAAGAESGNNESKINRDSTRATAFYEFRASDYIGNSTVAKIIGNQRVTGLLALDHKKQKNIAWSQYALGLDYATNNNFDPSVRITNYRLFNWVDYLGPTLQNQTSASGANISRITTDIAPAQNSTVTWFNSHWKPSLNPADPTYVNPNAPYTYMSSDTNQLTNSTQANNPANYVGWQQLPVTWLNANNPQDFPSLVTSGNKTKFRDLSKALVYQGYWLDGDLVGTYGWRKDDIVGYDTGAPIQSATGLAAVDYSDDPASRRETKGQTRTWGVVYHLPKALTKHLPWGTGLSFFYNRSHNFKADAPRFNVAGTQIDNPDGLTKEYGALLTTLDDKLTFKVTHYQTVVHNATLTGDTLTSLGGLSYLLDLIPAWGYGYAAMVQAGLDGKLGNVTDVNNNSWNYVVTDANSVAGKLGQPSPDLSVIGTPAGSATVPVGTYGYGGTGTVTMTDIVNAWLQMPVPDNFFDFYGITGNRPDPRKAHSTGHLYEGFSQPFANGGLNGVGGQQPAATSTPVSTVDNVSKGWEYELTAQPIKNWNITVNYSRTEATKTNIDPVTQKFMADNYRFYTGPGGQLRLWGANQTAGYADPTNLNSSPNLPPVYSFTPGQSNGSTVGPQWIAGVYNPYQVLALAQGQSAPEVAPWRLNLVTTYNFDHGRIKGLFVGGGARLEGGRILAYGLNSTTGVVDVNKTFRGPNDEHYDLWVGYSRKVGLGLGRDINWRIQLNLRNVGESTKLVAARYEPAPDSSGNPVLALGRIQEGMVWQLTNAFDF